MSAFCENCVFLIIPFKTALHTQWQCGARKKFIPYQFQTTEPALAGNEAPYYRASQLNPDGNCKHFQERPDVETTE